MKLYPTSLIVAALASLALVGCGCGSKGGSGSTKLDTGDLAVVNGETISMTEYYRYLERKPMVQVAVTENIPAGQAAELRPVMSLGFQALRDLINRRILLQVAADEKVTPTEKDIADELAFQTKADPRFMPNLTEQGMSLEEIRRDLNLDLAKEHILTKGITVTPKDVDEFIKNNPEKFMTGAEARLYIVQVRDDATKKQVDADLKSGKSFPTVAGQYSIDPAARKVQGLFPVSQVARMAPALQELVNSTPAGKTTDWKQDGGSWVKIFVDQKIESKKVPIDDMVREKVRRLLALERGSQANDLTKRLVEKLRASKIDVKPESLKKTWEDAFKKLQEQSATTDVTPSTRTSAAGGGTAGTAGAPSPGAPTTP